MTVTPEEFEDIKLESEGSLTEGFKSVSDLWAEAIGDDKIRTGEKEARSMGKLWNMALTRKIGKIWLTWNIIIVATLVTLIWAVPRTLKTVKFLANRRKAAKAVK